jgi:hypothetical protein
MHPLIQEFLVATLRHWLTMAGMWLLTRGWVGGDAADIEQFAGGFALLLMAFLWSYANKVRHRLAVLRALRADPTTPASALVPPTLSDLLTGGPTHA